MCAIHTWIQYYAHSQVQIGINPGLFAAYKGHHYAGPGNHFWKCMYLSGLTQEQMSAQEDYKLLKYGIGFTYMVQRATKGFDLSRNEIKEGSKILLEKLQRFSPKIAVFNGKLIFEVFSGKKDFHFGRQPEYVEGTHTYAWVMPSSSARCAQLPRAADKVPFYVALKTFRDFLNGSIPHIDESEFVFSEKKIKRTCTQENIKSARTELCAPTISPEFKTTNRCLETDYNNMQIQPIKGDPEKCIHHHNQNTDDDCNGCTTTAMVTGINDEYSSVSGQCTEARYFHKSDTEQPQITLTIQRYDNGSFMTLPYQNISQPKKKKRGRPKKIKGEDKRDSATCKSRHIMSQIPSTNNFVNKLGFTMMNEDEAINGGFVNIEAPKKKRGRPKKLKPAAIHGQISVMQPAQQQLMTVKLTGNMGVSSEQYTETLFEQTYAAHESRELDVHSTKMYPTISPMQLPSLSCTYSGITPPTSTQPTPPSHRQQHINDSDLIASPMNMVTAYTSETQESDIDVNTPNTYFENQNISSICSNGSEHPDSLNKSTPFPTPTTELAYKRPLLSCYIPNLCASLRPSSPNICAAGFDSPAKVGVLSIIQDKEKRNQRQPTLQEEQHKQNMRKASPAVESSNNIQLNTYQKKWHSPHPESFFYIHDVPTPPKKLQHFQNSYFQHDLHHRARFETTIYDTKHVECQQQQCYDNVMNSSYGLPSTPSNIHRINHIHQQKQLYEHLHYSHSNEVICSINDETSKSLLGLQSLVGRIPSVSEGEATHISLTTEKKLVTPPAKRYSYSYCQEIPTQNQQEAQHQQKHILLSDISSMVNIGSENETTSGTVNGNKRSFDSLTFSATASFNTNSLGSYSVQRLNTSFNSSPVIKHPHNHKHAIHQPYLNLVGSPIMGDVLLTSTPHNDSARYNDGPRYTSSIPDGMSHASTLPVTHTVSTSINTHNNAVTANAQYMSSYNSFSSNKLDRSSFTSSESCSVSSDHSSLANVPSAVAASNVYHHSNFMAAAALAAVAVNSTTNCPPVSSSTAVAVASHHTAHNAACTQVYVEPRRHLPSHMSGANTMYATTCSHLIAPHLLYANATASGQLTTNNDYINPYCTTSFPGTADQNSLQLTSPNYPYGYGSQETAAAVAHSRFPSDMNGTQPLQSVTLSEKSSNVSASAPAANQYSPSIFDQLNPSDTDSYGGFEC
ncbi:uncharacterized protein Tdg isoform X2 [Eurosta solidaginis]|uniref:uncharacterized protein Tdg isoform X2 n=1 Tax=Eurosta solidaginis TaxID=178769 RepID=UPI00353124BA